MQAAGVIDHGDMGRAGSVRRARLVCADIIAMVDPGAPLVGALLGSEHLDGHIYERRVSHVLCAVREPSAQRLGNDVYVLCAVVAHGGEVVALENVQYLYQGYAAGRRRRCRRWCSRGTRRARVPGSRAGRPLGPLRSPARRWHPSLQPAAPRCSPCSTRLGRRRRCAPGCRRSRGSPAGRRRRRGVPSRVYMAPAAGVAVKRAMASGRPRAYRTRHSFVSSRGTRYPSRASLAAGAMASAQLRVPYRARASCRPRTAVGTPIDW